MNWYYAEAGQQNGPVSEADFRNLVSSGKITGDTLVWHEGLTEWKPYSQIQAAAQPAFAGGVICAECGNTFAPDNVVRFGDVWVCAACKPTYVQKTREGVEAGSTRTGQVSIETVLNRDYDVNIGNYYTKSKAIYKANFGNVFGTTLAVMAILIVSGLIPFPLGLIAKILLAGPLMGGLYLFMIRLIRREPVGTGDAFDGFKSNFVNLLLAKVVSTILMYVCMVPGCLILGLGMFTMMLGKKVNFQSLGFQMTGAVVTGFILLGIGMIAMYYLMVCWSFALALIADKKFGFWQAMELSRKVISKHWWGTLGLVLVSGLLMMIGVLGCGIGVLFTLPFGFLMMTLHYERLFSDLTPAGE